MENVDAKTNKRRNPLKIVLIGIIGVIVLLWVIGSLVDGETTTSETSTSENPTSAASTTTPIPAILKVTSLKMSSDYQDNQVAADAKYKGNVVQISGAVQSIGKDILDKPYIELGGSTATLFGVQCMFGKGDEPQLATVSKGNTLTLQGRVSGSLVGNVIVNECSIVK